MKSLLLLPIFVILIKQLKVIVNEEVVDKEPFHVVKELQTRFNLNSISFDHFNICFIVDINSILF